MWAETYDDGDLENTIGNVVELVPADYGGLAGEGQGGWCTVAIDEEGEGLGCFLTPGEVPKTYKEWSGEREQVVPVKTVDKIRKELREWKEEAVKLEKTVERLKGNLRDVEKKTQKELKKQDQKTDKAQDFDDIILDFTVAHTQGCYSYVVFAYKLACYVIEAYTPFKSDVQHITTTFGESVGLYFAFHRWVLLTTMFVAVIMTPVFVPLHFSFIYRNADEITYNNTPVGWVSYSSFTEGEAGRFSVHMLTILAVYVASLVVKMQKVVKEMAQKELENDYNQATRYSRVALGLIDVSQANVATVDTMQLSAAASLMTLLAVDIHANSREPTTLQIKLIRVASITFQLLITLGSWIALLFIKVYELQIISSFTPDDPGATTSAFTNFIPSMMITAITMVLPVVITFLTDLESWSSPERRLVILVVRIYSIKIITVVVMMLQAYESLSKTHVSEGLADLLEIEPEGNSTFPACPEDKVSLDLLFLSATTVAGKIFSGFGWVGGRKVWGRVTRTTPEKREFDVAREVIDLLYMTAIMWLLVPLSPFATAVSVTWQLLLFKYDLYIIINHLKRPALLWSPLSATSWFLALYVLTFIITQIGVYYVWTQHTNELCGPFPTSPLLHYTLDFVTDTTFYYFVTLLVSPFVLAVIFAVWLVNSTYKKHYIAALEEHLSYVQEKAKTDTDIFRKQLVALKAKLPTARES